MITFRLPPAPLFLLAGAMCTVLHSLVDLPFRCPAVLVVWLLCLSCLPALAPVQSDGQTVGQSDRPTADWELRR
jgi:hypothetical protein